MGVRSGARFTVGLCLAAVLIVLAPAAAASGSSSGSSAWKKVLSEANAEGTVTWYTVATQTTYSALDAAFEAAYPNIKVSVFRGNTGQVIAKLESGGADVVVVNEDMAPTSVEQYAQLKQLAKVQGPNFKSPNFKAALDSSKSKGLWFWTYATVFEWSWNTNLLPKGIHSWADFLKSDLSNGKIAVFNPSQSSIVGACYQEQVKASGNKNWLQDLAKQKPVVATGAQQMDAEVAAGEVAAVDGWALPPVTPGSPVKQMIPPKGACVAALQGAVMKSAPDPAAGQVFANWLAGPQAQLILLQTGGIPALDGVPGSPTKFSSLKPSPVLNPVPNSVFIAKWDSIFNYG